MEANPFGMLSWVNCRCGNTLVLECEDTHSILHQQFLELLNEESLQSGRSIGDLLHELRDETRRRAATDSSRALIRPDFN